MSSMVTGAFRPSGARSAGQDAIAEASEAHEARIARFSASEARMRDHVPRVLELGAGMKEIVEIENVVVKSGRRPHGCLHF
jgi:hypothetical protein